MGRDEELAAIGRFLDSRTGVLLVEGEVGIGKTTLWRAGVELAAGRSYRVLAAQPAGCETELSFAALRDLLEGTFGRVEGELPDPQRRALAVALLLAEPQGPPPEPGAIAAGLLGTLRALARDRPLLVAVDDLQWLDPASAAALGYSLRRLREEPIMALLTRRAEAGSPPPVLDAFPRERLEVLSLGPLTLGALGHLLRHRLGASYPRPTLRRLHETSGGNPLYALEIARVLEERGASPEPGDPLPVGGSLRELLHSRLAALPAETLDGLLVAACLSRPTVALVQRALARPALPLLDPAVRRRVIDLDGERIRFSHPLLAALVYDVSLGGRRRDLHRRLAEVVADVEERARHLALGAEAADEQVAAAVEEGAQAALARGGRTAAAELAARARLLTPPERGDQAFRRALAEAQYRFESGDTEQAEALLDQLVADTAPGRRRALALARQARIRHFARDIAAGIALLEQALAEAGNDACLRAEIEEGLAWGLLLARRDLAGAAKHARSAAALAEQAGERAALAEALAARALIEFVRGGDWRSTMARALDLEEATLHLRVLRHPSFAYGYCLSCADQHEEARAVFQGLHRRALERGDESAVPSILNHLALIELLAGRWVAAEGYLEEGLELALELGQGPARASMLAKKAMLAARRGHVQAARETAAESLALAAGPGFDPARPQRALDRGGETAMWTLGFVALSLDEPEEAHRWLGPLAAALLAAGIREPGELRCLPDAIEALVALGRLEEAEARLSLLERWSGRLDRPSAHAAAARCRGLLLAAQQGPEEALAPLRQAADSARQAAMPFEEARTLYALGRAQRRAKEKRQARTTLERALALFESLGAELWTDTVRAEMARIGGRAPSPGELTPTERRVAELAAEGRSNREIAAAMFVTVKTVEFHLRHVYAKLGVRSRAQLARRLPASLPAGKD